ncbi:hypothetical protein BGX23_002084 [Mortierella sp. AD031]|nr:hypothetical protein BGX23_002084 [Mortierella sp. AD031]
MDPLESFLHQHSDPQSPPPPSLYHHPPTQTTTPELAVPAISTSSPAQSSIAPITLTNAGMTRAVVPPEVFFRIGKYLDGPSLFAAFQVSRAWKNILSRHIWTIISGVQWQHPTFPFRNTPSVPPESNNASLQQEQTTIATTPTSTNIIHLPNAITIQGDETVVATTAAAIQPNATDTTAIVPNEVLLWYHLGLIRNLAWMDVRAARRQHPHKVPAANEDLPLHRLVHILRMTTRINRLTIQVRRHRSYDSVLAVIVRMRGLNYLEIDLPL